LQPPASRPDTGAFGVEHQLKTLIKGLWDDQAGASMAEYALMLAIASVAVVAAMRSFGVQIGGTFESSASGLSAR